MAKLNIDPNLVDHDGFYAMLIDYHQDLSKAQSDDLNARLILILANHIGDQKVIEDAIVLAKGLP